MANHQFVAQQQRKHVKYVGVLPIAQRRLGKNGFARRHTVLRTLISLW